MSGRFTLEFWRDGDFYVGRLVEVPGVCSQGETLDELRENIQDAYDLMVTQVNPGT
jgi:predicted RNase H-like HicB family nuclease